MRRFLSVLLLLTALCLSAGAEISLQTEKTDAGEITYIAAESEALNELLSSRLGIGDALLLLRSGTEITGGSDIYLFEKNGISYASLRFTQQGKIRFGRYGQRTETLLIDLTQGAEASLESLVPETDALASCLDLYVEETVLPQLNTYLDTAELLPVPLENIWFSRDGLTIHYPSDRFSFFSGNSGAVEIKYFELGESFAAAFEGIAAPEEGDILTAAGNGVLPGVGQVSLDMTLESVFDRFGSLNDSDFIADGEIYEVEEPALRGVIFIMERGADAGEKLKAIRSYRLNLQGLKTGVTMREACLSALGQSQGSVTLDAAAAESYRTVEGIMDIYAAGAYTLKMYYDADGVLFASEIAR